MPDRVLTPAQIDVLGTASPAELQAMVTFGRNYVNGAWVACLIARTIVGIGAIAGAITAVGAAIKLLSGFKW